MDRSNDGADISITPLPPDDPFVTLSHALSWIAFRHSIGGPQLSTELGIGSHRSPLEVSEDAKKDDALKRAVKRLTGLGSIGKIEIRGQYFRDVLDDENDIFTERISQVRLADYQWFDTLDDSLHRGLGLAWNHNRQQPRYPSDARHIRFVTVNRADLLREFPVKKSGPIYSTGASEAKCADWLRSAFADDPQTRKAKPSFKTEALDKFHPTLSGRGFDRAWAAVAESAGRHTAGAKRKS